MIKPLIKKRKITVTGVKDRLSKDKIRNNLSKKEGIITVDVDSQKSCLNLHYDLKKINLERIEKFIRRWGFELSNRITERFKRGMAKFTEQNELDSLYAAPSSCCLDPKESCHERGR
jgi:copper chaperone CopZ